MSAVRAPAVAGLFYPGDAQVLARDLREFLDNVQADRLQPGFPKIVVVPHAGYIYSGAVAAPAYDLLRPARGIVRRVVLLGPCHRVPVRGMALPGAQAFDTPLGRVFVDHDAIARVRDLRFVIDMPEAHAQEHAIEVQLPFLQAVLGEFALVPFVVGAVHPEQVAQVIDRLWGGDETLIVVSSDLSHYLTYDTASAIDAGTAQAITSFDASITHEQACGATPLAGALLVAKRHGLAPRQLDVRNSGDTAGGKSRVVGYGSFSFGQTPVEYGEHHGRVLLGIARQAVVAAVGQGAAPQDVAAEAWLREIRATFVTIKARGELRGCVGTLEPARPLGQDVAANARAAVTIDRRFQPLGPADLDGLQVEVSVLSRPSRLVFEDHAGLIAQLEPGTDGLILEHGEGASTKRGTFLPQVWDSLPEPETFVAELKRKAGLPSSTRTTACAIKRYRVRKWRESEMKDEEPAQVT